MDSFQQIGPVSCYRLVARYVSAIRRGIVGRRLIETGITIRGVIARVTVCLLTDWDPNVTR